MKRVLLLILIVAATFPLGASVAAADDPLFLIESISVEGATYGSPSVIASETNLHEGASYTEAELHDGLLRVERLPFILHADLRLERGSERGRYRLIIVVSETKPLFISYKSLYETIDSNRLLSISRDPVTGEFTTITQKYLLRVNTESPSVGMRWFVAPHAAITAGVDLRGGDVFSLGYAQYDLFGSRASAALFVNYRNYAFDLPSVFNVAGRTTTSFSDHLSWDFAGALPLFGNNALRMTWHRERQPYQVGLSDHQKVVRITYDHPQLLWVFDTTNDLLLPTSGTYVGAGLDVRKDLQAGVLSGGEPGGPQQLDGTTHYRWNRDVSAEIRKYWQLTPVHSVSLGGTALTESSRRFQLYDLHAIYSAALLEGSRASRFGDLRFEVEGQRNFLHYDRPTSYGEARAGLVLRTEWGLARIDFRYIGWRHLP